MYKVGGYMLTIEGALDWAKRYGQDPGFAIEQWIDLKLKELDMNQALRPIVTDWPRGYPNHEGTPVVMLARVASQDPKATLAYFTRFRENEGDLKVKEWLKEQGLKPVWCTIPDPY